MRDVNDLLYPILEFLRPHILAYGVYAALFMLVVIASMLAAMAGLGWQLRRSKCK